MAEEAIKTIAAMDLLAARSLPPDLHDKWCELKKHYDDRIATGNTEGEQR